MRIVLIFLLSVFANSAKSQSPSILDLVVIGKDTIVASTHNMSIIVSHDGGKSWKTTERQLIKQLGLDGRRIWGIDSWIGIHESSYSRLFYSDDIGKTWKQIELNTNLFFAMEFIEVGGKLWIIDAQGNAWEHKTTNVETSLSWKKRTSFGDYGFNLRVVAYKDSYLGIGNDSLWIYNVKTKTLEQRAHTLEYVRLAFYKDLNTLFVVNSDGRLFKMNLKTKLFEHVYKIEQYKWFNSLVLIEDSFFVLGLLDDGKQEDAVLTRINSKFESKKIEGLKGVDQDVCFIDKYKRIWIGTTKGMFVVVPGSDKCKQIL